MTKLEGTKLYALPMNWPTPEYAIGEVVYDKHRRGYWYPEPGRVVGLVCYPSGDDPAAERMEQGIWRYLVAFSGYQIEEWAAEDLTRESWEYTPQPDTSQQDDYDPFLDPFDDDLP
jgi:hypothetical protein